MDTLKKSYLQLHFSVFLWGFTAILGALITLEALDLVWWRMLITSLSFVLLLKGFKAYKAYPPRKVLTMMGIGCIVALHWLCFYGSVKLANASVALIGVSTAALFSALFEPFVFKKRISKLEVFLGLMVIPGIALIVNTLRQDFHLGLYVGIASGILASTFTVLNKKAVVGVKAKEMSFIELSAGFLFLTLFMPFFGFADGFALPKGWDVYYLLLLAIGCTTLPFVLSLEALKHLSAFVTNLSVNLEPIYGLILAVVILKENQELNFGFYLGCAIILFSVFSYPLLKSSIKKRKKYEFSEF
jgi:drug/metabolite transporter (DMT)-like permease